MRRFIVINNNYPKFKRYYNKYSYILEFKNKFELPHNNSIYKINQLKD